MVNETTNQIFWAYKKVIQKFYFFIRFDICLKRIINLKKLELKKNY